MRLDNKLVYRILEESSNFETPDISPEELWTVIAQTYGYTDGQQFGYTLDKMYQGDLISKPSVKTKTGNIPIDFDITYDGHMFLNSLEAVPKEKLNSFFVETAKMSIPTMIQAAKSQFGF